MTTKIALLTNTLSGGGMERAIVNIANQLADNGYSVDLLLAACKGDLFEELNENINIICLDKEKKFSLIEIFKNKKLGALRNDLMVGKMTRCLPKALKCIKPISRYISDFKPALILSTPMTANIAVIKAIEFSDYKPVVILREASTLSEEKVHSKSKSFKKIAAHVNDSYSIADRIVCVSVGVKEDLVRNYGIDENKCIVIRNPIDCESLIAKSKLIDGVSDVYDRSIPYIFSMGRLEEQKDFKTLIKAFNLCHKRIPHNLLILGEGTQRDELQSLIKELNIQNRVFMPGFVKNPYPYLSSCDLFVLSSRWEGLANVLREAIVFNKKIVATDCPSGTKEILASYSMGKIVDMGDCENMSHSINEMLNSLLINDDNSDHINEKESDYLDAIARELE